MTKPMKDPSAAMIGFAAAAVGLMVIGIAMWSGAASATVEPLALEQTYAVSMAEDITLP